MSVHEVIDQPQAVRAGEELNETTLRPWLEKEIGAVEGPLQIEQFPRGFSNLTYRVSVPTRDGLKEFVLRRPPVGSKVRTAHDVLREYRILTALTRSYGRIPRPIAHCDDLSILGAPFFIMERVQGIILRQRKPDGLALTPPAMRALSEAFVDNLVDIHSLDYRAELADLGKPEGYVHRQVSGWSERYTRARTDDVNAMERIARWLALHLPTDEAASLIHNDYKYDNLILDPDDLTNIRAVLDWEMATIGHPLMDLGTSLAYWVEASDPTPVKMLPFGLTALEGNLTRRELTDRYADKSGRDVTNMRFYYVFGLFKIAVVAQQIFTRYKQGLTRDERFASLLDAIRVLSEVAMHALSSNELT